MPASGIARSVVWQPSWVERLPITEGRTNGSFPASYTPELPVSFRPDLLVPLRAQPVIPRCNETSMRRQRPTPPALVSSAATRDARETPPAPAMARPAQPSDGRGRTRARNGPGHATATRPALPRIDAPARILPASPVSYR